MAFKCEYCGCELVRIELTKAIIYVCVEYNSVHQHTVIVINKEARDEQAE